MKKLLLSTLILTSSLMLAPIARRAPVAPVGQAPVGQAQQTSTIADAIKQLQANIQQKAGPIADRLKALDNHIAELTKAIEVNPELLPEDAKTIINDVIAKLETEANELWEKFGGKTYKWLYPTYQSAELQQIVRHIENIKNLYNQVNPTNIFLRPVYHAASTATSFAKKNPWSTALCSFLVYRLGKACYNNGLYPSSQTLANAGNWAKWVIIG